MITVDKLYGFIYKNLESLKKDGIKIKKIEISDGDRYNNTNGAYFIIEFFKDKYNIGYSYETEDCDDWGQAECYEQKWCMKNDKHIKPKLLHELLLNYKSIKRDNMIDSLLNNSKTS
jgi:hypothetical protein